MTKRPRKALAGLILLSGLLLAGCGSTRQEVRLDTPGVSGAQCTLRGTGLDTTVTTPVAVTIETRRTDVQIICQKECYEDGWHLLTAKLNPWTFLALPTGFIGVGAMSATGDINRYDEQVNVAMTAVPGCQPGG